MSEFNETSDGEVLEYLQLHASTALQYGFEELENKETIKNEFNNAPQPSTSKTEINPHASDDYLGYLQFQSNMDFKHELEELEDTKDILPNIKPMLSDEDIIDIFNNEDQDSDSNDSYHSSDFEFITEEEASLAGIITKHDKQPTHVAAESENLMQMVFNQMPPFDPDFLIRYQREADETEQLIINMYPENQTIFSPKEKSHCSCVRTRPYF